jgi:putative oxidoreductase
MIKMFGDKTSRKLLMFGPLPVRIMAGILFIAQGLPKLENISVNQGSFGSLGLPPELALPIALFEVIGFLPTIVEEPLNDMVNMIDSAH